MRISDWSSDVLSSDLRDIDDQARRFPMALDRPAQIVAHAALHQQGAEAGSVGRDDHARAAALAPAQPELAILGVTLVLRSEELRVGIACVSTWRSRWSPDY